MIIFNRAYASSEDILTVGAVRQGAEAYNPDTRVFQYDRTEPPGNEWAYRDFPLSIQDVRQIRDHSIDPPQSHIALLSAEGDLVHLAQPDNYEERIVGAGTTYPDSKGYGKVLKLRQIGETLFVVGAGGQVYARKNRNEWALVTNDILFNMEAYLESVSSAPNINDFEAYMAWLDNIVDAPVSPNYLINDIAGLAENAVYICGETGPKPYLSYWDGQTLEELPVPLGQAALTGIHIESSESIWVCGRDGVILHGSRSRGFNPVNMPTRNNLFHGFTPYRGKLILAASVRPGGLFALDPATGEFARFRPGLPSLTRPPQDSIEPHGGPFFVQAVREVLWVVGLRDIFRFDGSAWERIKHPDMP